MQDDPDYKKTDEKYSTTAVITSRGCEFMIQKNSKQLLQFIFFCALMIMQLGACGKFVSR